MRLNAKSFPIIIFFLFLSEVVFAKGFIVKPFTSRGDMTITIIPNRNGDGVLDSAETQIYSPNVQEYSGISFGYKDLSFSYGSTNPATDRSKLEFGTTNYNDFQFHLFKKNIGVDLYYQTF